MGGWKDRLAGARLERQSHISRGAGAEAGVQSIWDLCRDGTFHTSHSSSASIDIPGSLSLSTNQVSDTGKWSVEIHDQDALLRLAFRNGRPITHRLHLEGPTMYLDGEQVSFTRSTLCS